MCPKKLVRQSDEPGHLTGNPETAQTTWANKLVLKRGLKTWAQKVLNLNIMPFWAEEPHNEKRIFSYKKLCSMMSCHKTVNIIGSNDSTTARTASWVVLVVERTECAWMTTIIATLSASVDTTGLNVAFLQQFPVWRDTIIIMANKGPIMPSWAQKEKFPISALECNKESAAQGNEPKQRGAIISI